jgi:hypothetical protein
MSSHSKSRRIRSRAGKPSPSGHDSEARPPVGAGKSLEEQWVRQWVHESQALLEPGQFDPVKAGRLKAEFDALMQSTQLTKAPEDQFFDWLEADIPELFNIKGRPKWVASEKVVSEDKALLDNFDQTLERNIAANAGKEHGATNKTYADLADEFGYDDPYTVKQRVMRARRRQKALQETVHEILDIAGRAKTRGDKAVPPAEVKSNKKKLLKAFRRVLRLK